jgi:endonuclease YncB( thermonuclease family)
MKLPCGLGSGPLVVWSGVKYRLDGIDAPESAQQCLTTYGKPWKCGVAASAALNAFIVGKAVTCNDVGEDRKYHRRLGQCFVDGVSIEHWLVQQGWAIEFKMHSDGRFASDERDANSTGAASGRVASPIRGTSGIRTRPMPC